MTVLQNAFIRRRPSMSSLNTNVTTSTERSHSFSFPLPQSTRTHEEMPATFVSTKDASSQDYFEITYKVVANWHPSDSSETPSQYVAQIMA